MNTVAADVRPAKIDDAHSSVSATATATATSDRLEEASELLEAVGGSLGVLACFLERLENIGTDTPLAVYAAGHAVAQARKLIEASLGPVMAFEQAAH